MPFLQSMAVRFGVKSFLENIGLDEEDAAWFAAGASLLTAVTTADIHGHIAGEAASHAVSHATSHATSHVTSHAVSHGVSASAGHASNHALNETANQVTNNDVSSFQDTSHIQRSGGDGVNWRLNHIASDHPVIYEDANGRWISPQDQFHAGDKIKFAGNTANAIPEPGLGDHRWKDGILVQHVDNNGHVYGEGHWLHVGDLQGWSRSTPPHS